MSIEIKSVGGCGRGDGMSKPDKALVFVVDSDTPFDASSLPEHPRLGMDVGYVYVIEFSTGIVKVGQTRSPRARLLTHANEAAKFGSFIQSIWLSIRHENCSASERLILSSLDQASVEYGNEYFRMPFADAVGAACSIHYELVTDERIAALIEESSAKAKRLTDSWFGCRTSDYVVRVPDAVVASVLQSLFGELPDNLGEPITDRETLELRLSELSQAAGVPVDEVAAWSWTDVIERLSQTLIKSAFLGMKIRALEAGRLDLTHAPFFGRGIAS